MMNALEEKSGGLVRPSTKTIGPALQQHQDEGLVTSQEEDSKRICQLTGAGRARLLEEADRAASH